MDTNQQLTQRPVYTAPMTQKDGTSSLKKFNRVLMNADMQNYLLTVLGARKEQFVNNLLALVGNDTKLQACTPQSLIFAGTKATALGLPLDPNLGFAYVIPYNNTKRYKEMQLIAKTADDMPVEREVSVEEKVKEAQFQIGYKGFIQLAIRTGQYRTLNVTDIRAGELGRKDLVTGKIEIRNIEHREEQPIIGYLAYFALINGFSKMLYMTIDEIKQHATTYSQTYGSRYESTRQASRWTTDFDVMARKTVLKLLLNRYAPLSVDIMGASELKEAIRVDQAVIRDNDVVEYVDGTSDSTEVSEASIAQQKEQMRTNGNKPEQLL